MALIHDYLHSYGDYVWKQELISSLQLKYTCSFWIEERIFYGN